MSGWSRTLVAWVALGGILTCAMALNIWATQRGDQVHSVRLPLQDPIAAAGDARGVWVADRVLQSVSRFDPDGSGPVAQIRLEDSPVDVALSGDLLWIALRNGAVLAHNSATGDFAFRHSLASAHVRLRAGGERLYAATAGPSGLVQLTRDGGSSRLDAADIAAFAPGALGVYWISADGTLRFAREGATQSVDLLFRFANRTGAMVVCANSLWVSVPDALVLMSATTLEVRSELPATEGPVRHLICDADQRIIGGTRGVFVLDPSADDDVRHIELDLASELQALVAAGDRIWALESAEPTVHILHLP